jgi:Domain of unknown function (DUF4167)
MAENYLQHAEHYNRIIMAAQAQMQQPMEGGGGGMHSHRMRHHPADVQGLDDGVDGEGDDAADGFTSGQAAGPQQMPPHNPMREHYSREHQGQGREHQGREQQSREHQGRDGYPMRHDRQERPDRQDRQDRDGGHQRFPRHADPARLPQPHIDDQGEAMRQARPPEAIEAVRNDMPPRPEGAPDEASRPLRQPPFNGGEGGYRRERPPVAGEEGFRPPRRRGRPPNGARANAPSVDAPYRNGNGGDVPPATGEIAAPAAPVAPRSDDTDGSPPVA